MKKFELLAASAMLLSPTVAWAQTGGTTSAQNTQPTNEPGQEAPSTQPQSLNAQTGPDADIVVTAQRQSQRLQDVPIAVSAFTADNLEKQQIVNPTALQQSLPSITFTKTNFTSSSFTIRGIGDLCVGATCDSATAIHVNDMPLVSTRLFESEFYDLERIEVLRGPQGTLFGRNATSGVVNFITAKPDLSGIHAAGEFEYGNYDSKRARGMFNLPITDTLGIRVAGQYLNRDGYTRNLYDNSRVDGRDLYSVRGTLSWEPTSTTRVDLIGYYFHERDDRSRIQKQLCHRDPTGVLGCLPDRLANETTNGNSTLAAAYSSTEFYRFALGATFAPYSLQSLYGTTDAYAGVVNPTDVRTVRIDHDPTYFADEEQYTAKVFHDFGPVSFNLTGGYARNSVDSTTDYNLAVENPLGANVGALTLIGTSAAPGAAFPGGVNPFTQAVAALFPNRNTATICQSAPGAGLGVFAGQAICGPQSQDIDRSNIRSHQYSIEAHIDSKLDGPFNFLLGGIYLDQQIRDNNYYVTAFPLDYGAAIIGAANALGTRVAGGTIPNVFGATPFYDSDTRSVRLKSYGAFGETYIDFTDKLKLTLGLRYNHDEKTVQARNTFIFDTKSRTLVNAAGAPVTDREGNVITVSAVATALAPYGATALENAVNYATLDYDPTNAGNQPFSTARVSFGRLTGRAVLDFRITPDNLLYASYSRGYKSGGINPPLAPVFAVAQSFAPESVDAFEIGSKNTFGGLRLNLTGFYYRYKQLQLSRIVARTSVNDNINADIYGVEAEAIARPTPALVVNMNFSYLHTRVSKDKLLGNPQDPSAGRSDTVIIKDITNASNCAVRPTTAGNAAGANAFVAAVNGAIGLRAPTAIPGTFTTGAFSVCDALAAASAGALAAYNPALAALQAPLNAAFNGGAAGSLPFVVDRSGVLVNIRGNELPQAPRYKASIGAQYTLDFGGYSLVPRVDLNYTGDFYASIFNRNINRVRGYEVVNAQIQLNAPDDRFYVRGFVQNLTKNDGITGQYVTDQSSGLFTNIFTVEPRRYGVAAGFKF